MSGTTNERGGSTDRPPESRSGGRLSALLHTNLFSLGDVISWIRWREPWWPAVLDRSGLMGEPRDRIFAIVRRTRLWNNERAEVARELCSHAAEALDAGRSPEEVAESLGEAKTVARLLRRSMKRKRPLTWQIRAWTLRGMGFAAAAVLLVAGAMTARFFVGDPSITRNFVAELNEPLERYEDDEKSWPLLKEAWASFAPKRHLAEEAMRERADAYQIAMGDTDAFVESHALRGLELLLDLPADHPDRDAVMALYRDVRGELDLMREAARRPVVGRLFSTKRSVFPEELDGTPAARGWIGEPVPDSDDPAEQDWVVGVLLPTLSPQRAFSRWFAFDATVRLSEGDADGAVDSIEAMLGLADQVERDQFVIGYLVAMAIEHLATQAVSDMLVEHGDALGDEHLVRLAHLLGAPRLETIPLEGEEMMLDDFLQRAFTDDGNGDGYLTNEGLEMLNELQVVTASVGDGIVESVGAVKTIALVAPRAEQERMAQRGYALLREEENAGYGLYRGVPTRADVFVETLDRDRYMPVATLMPALSKVVTRKLERRARVEACLVGIAAELYRRDTGAWPDSVVDLSPRYLPFVPEDPVTGDPISIAPGDRSIRVYALGPDGDDDGGRMDPTDERSMRPRPATNWIDADTGRVLVSPFPPPSENTPDGDWVLFPAPD